MTYPQEEYRYPIKQLFAVSCSAHASSDEPCSTPPTRPLLAVRLVEAARPLLAVRLVEAARQAANRASSDPILTACYQPDASSTGRGLVRSSTQLMSHPSLPNPGFSAPPLSPRNFPRPVKKKTASSTRRVPQDLTPAGLGLYGACIGCGDLVSSGSLWEVQFRSSFSGASLREHNPCLLASWGWKGTSGLGGGA